MAGSAATSVLWALGAEVTTVIDPASPHRRGRPAAGARGASLLPAALDRGKALVRGVDDLAGIEALIGSGADGAPFDVVVVDRVGALGGALGPLADLDAYVQLVERCNGRAWVTISAFGLTGGRGADPATELTVAAASGMLSAVRDPATGRPLKLGGQQSLLNTGQAAALAACHALDLAAEAAPVHLDLAAVEATLAMGPVLEVGGLLLQTGGAGGAKRYGAPASFYECSDGHVRISAMENHQWQGVVAAMGSPAWTARFATVEARIEDPDEIDRQVEAWTGQRTKRDAESVLQANGVPASAVYAPTEILDSPQLRFRDAFEPLLIGGEVATVVGLPFRVVGRGEGAGGHRHRSLRGLRLLEASRVLAVPLAGAILGALGADVTKLEDLPRLDMYRRRGPYIDGSAGEEQSAYFALMNHSKRSAAFDVDADRDRLHALLDSSDVVIENLGRKRAISLGVAPAVLPGTHPAVLSVSSSGFGQDGPHAEFRAYAYNLQASGGLGYLTRNDRGEGAEIDIAWADLISAYSLATIIAAWAVGPSGNPGAGLDFSMIDLVVSHFNEYLAAASLDAGSDRSLDRANELAPYAPHGVYRAGEGWVAIAVDGDDQFAALTAVLAHPGLGDTAYAHVDGRSTHRARLDSLIDEAAGPRSAATLAAELRTAGVWAEAVETPSSLLDSPTLVERGFFVPVDHHDWGRRRLVGLPWRRYGGPPLPLTAAPRLGEERRTQ